MPICISSPANSKGTLLLLPGGYRADGGVSQNASAAMGPAMGPAMGSAMGPAMGSAAGKDTTYLFVQV